MSVIYGVLTFVLLLTAISLSNILPTADAYDPTIDIALRIAVVFLGLGAVALRRARFSPVRLQAIATLRGASGLLETLQKTTVLVALIAAGIALLGLVLTYVQRGQAEDMRGEMFGMPAMVWIGLIAVAVLLYAYPRRAAWRRVLQLAEQNDLPDAPPAKGTVA